MKFNYLHGFAYLDFAAAAAAALSAFEVPGLFEADDKLPKRLVGFGAMILAFGREVAAAAGLASGPISWGRLAALVTGPLVGFWLLLRFDVTTIRFVAG